MIPTGDCSRGSVGDTLAAGAGGDEAAPQPAAVRSTASPSACVTNWRTADLRGRKVPAPDRAEDAIGVLLALMATSHQTSGAPKRLAPTARNADSVTQGRDSSRGSSPSGDPSIRLRPADTPPPGDPPRSVYLAA